MTKYQDVRRRSADPLRRTVIREENGTSGEEDSHDELVDDDFVPTTYAQRVKDLKGRVRRTRHKATAVWHLRAAGKLILSAVKKCVDLGKQEVPQNI